MHKFPIYHSLMLLLFCAALWVMPAHAFSSTSDAFAGSGQ